MASRADCLRASVLVLVAAIVALVPANCHAREGFYLGYGFIGQTAKGDLNGTTNFTDKANNQYLVGSLNSGVGSMFQLGYGFGDYFALELLGAASQHTASYTGKNDTDATLSWGGLGVRLAAPLGKSFEFFLRLAETSVAVDYRNYVLLAPGLTSTTDVSYTGYGSLYGGGFEIMGDHFGIEFSYLVHAATLNQAKASGVSGTFDLPHHLQVPVTTSAIAFKYHFK